MRGIATVFWLTIAFLLTVVALVEAAELPPYKQFVLEEHVAGFGSTKTAFLTPTGCYMAGSIAVKTHAATCYQRPVPRAAIDTSVEELRNVYLFDTRPGHEEEWYEGFDEMTECQSRLMDLGLPVEGTEEVFCLEVQSLGEEIETEGTGLDI